VYWAGSAISGRLGQFGVGSNNRYQKAGVMLSDIFSDNVHQGDLFATQTTSPRDTKLMSTLDQINLRMGKGAIKLASDGIGQSWKMKAGNKSPAYTTQWNELPAVC
jgi:DNA polymerase V